MKIKVLKSVKVSGKMAKSGDVCDAASDEANVLIAGGFAESPRKQKTLDTEEKKEELEPKKKGQKE